MPQRRSPAQIKSQIRQAQSRARQSQQKFNQAVRNYNREVDKANAARRQFLTDYNSAVRKHNRAVDAYNREQRRRASVAKSNKSRLQQELRRLERSSATSAVRVEFRTSVDSVASSLERLEDRQAGAPWSGTDVLDLSRGEVANGVASVSAFMEGDDGTDPDGAADDVQASELQETLDELDPEIGQRWAGALYSLNPANPDAARHFCTSAREMLADVLERLAPSDVVEAQDPDCDRTPQGSVSRRAKVRYCLGRTGLLDDDLEDFVEEDIENVVALFYEFNSGTHGSAGKFTIRQLRALKQRVEDAIFFVLRVGTPETTLSS